MKNVMFIAILGSLSIANLAAQPTVKKTTGSQPVVAPNASSPRFEAETALADKALAAHGGEKLRAMKTLIVRGSADVTASAFNQAMPATFVLVLAKEKYRLEIVHPFISMKQAYDGVNTLTTIQGGFTLPPLTRVGFPLLQMVGQTGFIITGLPETNKRKKGFRMTSPEGLYTDFYLDGKTNQIAGYDSSYDMNGRVVTTSVEIDKFRVVDGITVPERWAQRFDTEQVTMYADFKAKEILVNNEVADEIFSSIK
jgi:hypothetical protein